LERNLGRVEQKMTGKVFLVGWGRMLERNYKKLALQRLLLIGEKAWTSGTKNDR